jgi:hypothetical protein
MAQSWIGWSMSATSSTGGESRFGVRGRPLLTRDRAQGLPVAWM